MQWLQEAVAGIVVLAAFVGIVAAVVFFVWRRQTRRSIANLLKRHFRPKSLTDVAVNERQFPPHIRVDLFGAVEDFTRGVTVRSFFGVSAEQVGLLGEYMTLARLLQPSLVVIEDVDLIARERTRMRDTRSELLLNKLLNEMDGLREDADILFILTTNRPEKLEAALASRPGRIDQAIEFPLPDSAGREKLARLYSRGVTVPDDVIQAVVKRTEKVSASFIKELMRRAVQFHLERNASRTLDLEDVDSALDEMLFSGGSLNLKLLGAEQRAGDTRPTED